MIGAKTQLRGAGVSAEPGFHASAAATERGRLVNDVTSGQRFTSSDAVN